VDVLYSGTFSLSIPPKTPHFQNFFDLFENEVFKSTGNFGGILIFFKLNSKTFLRGLNFKILKNGIFSSQQIFKNFLKIFFGVFIGVFSPFLATFVK
jgi:hypothetical protein